MYKLEYLPSSLADILEIEDYLFEIDPDVADRFTEAIQNRMDSLAEHPFMHQIYEDNNYFRSMPLIYSYRVFYHVDEASSTIKVHRILHGMRNLKRLLS